MERDPVREEEVRAWLEKAGNDLRAAEVDLQAEPPLLDDALFHCQQAVEKTLKAFLTWHDRPFRKTHNLVELGMQCVEIDPSPEPLLRRAGALSEYAWRYRYPGDVEEPTRNEATSALRLAQEIMEAVRSRIPLAGG